MKAFPLLLILLLSVPAAAGENIDWPEFGRAANAIKRAQILNPGGVVEPDKPVEGLDGQAAAGAVKRYREAEPGKNGSSGSLSDTTYSVMSIGGGQ